MESLIVFLIFIVFSVLRSLGGDGKRPPARGPAVPPVRPLRPVRPVPSGTRELHPYDITGQYGRHGDEKTMVPSVDVVQEKGKHAAAGARPMIARVESDREYTPSLSEENVLMGVIFSEILAPPKAVRRR